MSLKIHTLPVGQLTTNCYLLINPDTHQALIIDPGDSAEYIINILRDQNAKPLLIIATHGHFDHILAIAELKLAFGIPFVCSRKDAFLVSRMRQSAQHFLKLSIVDPEPAIDTDFDGVEQALSSFELKVIKTPGHTPGSICLYHAKERFIFTGDTLFADGGVGRTDFSYSSKEDLGNSLKKLFSLPGEVSVYSGHGEPTTIQKEKEFHS